MSHQISKIIWRQQSSIRRQWKIFAVTTFTHFFIRWAKLALMGQRPDLTLEAFRRRIEAGQPVIINGDGTQRRDLTHVADVARAVGLALRWRGPGSTVLNVGTGKNHSVTDLLAAGRKAATPQVEHQCASPGGRAGNPRVDHGRRGATQVATPDSLPGQSGIVTVVAHG